MAHAQKKQFPNPYIIRSIHEEHIGVVDKGSNHSELYFLKAGL
jgi:hypothetical protein